MSGNDPNRRDDEQQGNPQHGGREGGQRRGPPPEHQPRGSQRRQNQGQGGQRGGQGQRGQRGQRSQQGQQPQQRGQQNRRSQQGPPGQDPPGQGPPAQPPQGGGGTDLDLDAIKRITIWVTVAFAATGLVLGLLPALYGSISESSTEIVEVDQNGNPVDGESPTQDDGELTDQEQAAQAERDQRQQNQFKQQLIIGLTGVQSQSGAGFFFVQAGLTPFLAVVLAVAMGLVVGVFSSLGTRDLAVATGVSIVVGTVAFVFLSHFLAVQQWPTMPNPEYVEPMRQDLSVRTGSLLINGVLIGVTAAIGGVAAAVSGGQLSAE